MRRRAFIALLGGAAAWPLAARGQNAGRARRIGALISAMENDPAYRVNWAAFMEALAMLGWSDGQNLRIEARWGAADAETMQQAAKELVALQPELIFSQNTPTTAALLQQTRSIPIVFAQVVDPVGTGFTASLSRPGGNVTGFLNLEASVAGKWLELLKEIAPRVARAAFVFHPATAPFADYFLNPFKTAASSLRLEAIAAPVADLSALDAMAGAQASAPNGGLVVMPDSYLVAHRAEVASLAARHRLPTVYPFRTFAEVGGLLSYGNQMPENYRRAATYVDRILKGANPGELPMQAPVQFELVINLKTARMLDLDVPVQLQQRADEIIE
jgi:putative ABC transport system substrate-binding protein